MTRRLLFSYLTIAVIILVLLQVPLGRFYQQREVDRLTVGVERDANALATLYEEALEKGTPVNPAVADKYAARTGVRVVVVDKAGVSLIDTAPGSPAGRDFSSRPEVAAALRGLRTTGVRHSDDLNTDLLYVAVPAASAGKIYGAVRLTMDTAEVRSAVHRFWFGLAGIAAVVLVVVAIVGWAIARSVTRPLRKLHVAAVRFATGDLTPIDPDPQAPPEIAALGATMNTMAQRLALLLAEQRQFVADASHQLRTPLTALRLRLENLQSETGSESAIAGGIKEDRRAAGPATSADIAAAIDETGRLADLVGGLLQLARAEEAAAPVPADLVQLARDRVDTWSAVAEVAGVSLDFMTPDCADDESGTVMVSAVPNGIEQILDNLIDNAITASPRGAGVAVRINCGDERHSLIIADHGPGLSDELKTRALDRFWRLDSSHPGTGLGLPIAQALARASGGSLSLGDTVAGGLTVTVHLPAAPG